MIMFSMLKLIESSSAQGSMTTGFFEWLSITGSSWGTGSGWGVGEREAFFLFLSGRVVDA